MSLLARFDPGDAVTGVVIVSLVQTSVIILFAAVCGRTLLRRRPELRHAIWLGALILVLICPGLAVVADRSNLAPWVVTLPIPGWAAGPVAADQGSNPATLPTDSLTAATSLRDGPIAAEASPPEDLIAMPRAQSGRVESQLVAAPFTKRRGSPLIGGLTVLWGLVALAGLGRMAVGWRRLAGLWQSALPLDSSRHGAALAGVKAALGSGTLPPIVTSPIACGPVAIGLLRPSVVLPDGLADTLASDALCDVLVHECAHVMRCDAWVGLLQRLARVLLWPHPLIHYLSGQLTRAREEVCDNYVLRCGTAPRYARTLLAMTEQYLAVGSLRAGLGLLGARWTLADRVAGLLDPRRIPMTRTTFRMKIAMAVALATTGLTVSSLRFDRAAGAGEPIGNQVDPKPVRPAEPRNAVWSIEGVVVDDQGKPVPGAVIHAREEADPVGAKTAADGTFTLWLGSAPLYTRELVAHADGGARIGLVQFDPPRQFAAKDPVRLVIKPARTVLVRVKDAAGAPIPGAAVEAFDFAYHYHTATGPDGLATLRVPADARIQGVVGLKSGAGFDYFENYRTNPPSPSFAFPPLPGEITLTLDGARTKRIKVVDPTGRPVPGVVVKPFRPKKAGKIATIEIARGATTSATTDAQGVAVFDWLPKIEANGQAVGFDTSFFIEPPIGFFPPERRSEPAGTISSTSQLRRSARLSGTVRFTDGRPARGILIIAGLTARGWIPTGARTDDGGRYFFDPVAPGASRMIIVNDENWAAPGRTSDVLAEGQEQRGLDFTLIKGTLVHGRVTEGPEHRPAGSVGVALVEQGGHLPKELRTVRTGTYQMSHLTFTDAQGNYRLRVGPGHYRLRTSGLDAGEPVVIDVQNQAEIARDLAATARVRETFITGVVVEKTATGERAVGGAFAFRWPVYGMHRTDDEGKFMFERSPGETTLYALLPGKSLAGFARLAADAKNAKVVVSKTGTVTGRVIDSNGKPLAKRRVRVQLANGAYATSPAHFAVSVLMTDDHGRFTYTDAPVGSTGEFEAFHEKDDPRRVAFERSGPRTVVPFEVSDLDPIEVTDLVVPPDKPAK